MSELLDELRKVQRLGGDTYSSAEVIGLVVRAADEIERLRTALNEINLLAAGKPGGSYIRIREIISNAQTLASAHRR